MAKNKDRRRPPVAPIAPSFDLLDDDMKRHVEELGFTSISAYFAWCRQHGFPCGLAKPWRARARELQRARSLGGGARLAAHERVRNPAEAVRRVLAGDAPVAPEHLEVAAVLRGESEPAERRALLVAVLRRLAAVMPECLGPRGAGIGLALRASEHHAAVVRRVDGWEPRTHNERRALGTVVAHLFARYDVPAWLLGAWFADDAPAEQHRRWYLHVAAGNNLRTAAGLPFVLTKRMAHEAVRAPAGLSVLEALRFGQVRGLGGRNRLARAIVLSRLGNDAGNDGFWRTFVLFCMRHGIDDAGSVGAMVDFLHAHRHGEGAVVDERGAVVEVAPVQPGLSMHGRTPESLRKQIDAWHARLGKGSAHDVGVRWAPSGIAGYRAVTDPGGPRECTWVVRELCTALELRAESAAMSHCVYSYRARCVRGHAAIFAMTATRAERSEPVATIEVVRARIVQARGPANRALSSTAREHLRRWAAAVGLPIAEV